MILKKLLLITGMLAFVLTGRAEKIDITIKGVRSTEGNLLIGVYKDNESFQNDTPFKRLKVSKSAISNGTVNYTFNLPAGTYGFALLDDENDNKKMDESFFGIPEEGYGFSGYVHSGMFRPVFADFDFIVKAGKAAKVNIMVDYF